MYYNSHEAFLSCALHMKPFLTAVRPLQRLIVVVIGRRSEGALAGNWLCVDVIGVQLQQPVL